MTFSLSTWKDHVAIEPPDTVLLKVLRTSLSARPGDNVSVPQTAQRFKFSQVSGACQQLHDLMMRLKKKEIFV